MSALQQRLAQFEKTIKNNEESGCSGASFLANIIQKPKSSRSASKKTGDKSQALDGYGDCQGESQSTFPKASLGGVDDTSVTFEMCTSHSEFDVEDDFATAHDGGDSDVNYIFNLNNKTSKKYTDVLDEVTEVSEDEEEENELPARAGKDKEALDRAQLLMERSLMESWNSKRLRIARKSRKPKPEKVAGPCLQARMKTFEEAPSNICDKVDDAGQPTSSTESDEESQAQHCNVTESSVQDKDDDTSMTLNTGDSFSIEDFVEGTSDYDDEDSEIFATAHESNGSFIFSIDQRVERTNDFLDDLLEDDEECAESKASSTGVSDEPSDVASDTCALRPEGNITDNKSEANLRLLERCLMESWNSKRLRIARASRKKKPDQSALLGMSLQDRLRTFQQDA